MPTPSGIDRTATKVAIAATAFASPCASPPTALAAISSATTARTPEPSGPTIRAGQRSTVSPRFFASATTWRANSRCHARETSSVPVVSASVGTTPSIARVRNWSTTMCS